MKFVIDDNGKTKDRYIFMEREWRQVDKGDFNRGWAVSGEIWFEFDAKAGWVEMNRENSVN